MSRLIVKNLPKNVTDKKLKEIFSEKGIVTDVQLKHTPDGQFRRFAFIGFKTEEEASAAKEYFHKTCIETCRISVEHCSALGDASKPQSWSKYAPDSKINKDKNKVEDKVDVRKEEQKDNNDQTKKDKKKEQKKKIKDMLEKYKDDPLFVEFLETHTPKEALKLWHNDGIQMSDNEKENSENEEKVEENNAEEIDKYKEIVQNKNISDKEYMELLKKKDKGIDVSLKEIKDKDKHGTQTFFTVKVNGLAYSHKKKDIKKFFKPLKPKSIRVPPKIKGIAYVGFKTEKMMKQALNKNKSFLDGKQLFITKYVKQGINKDTESDSKNINIRWKQQEEALKDEENIAESGKIFLRNLTYTTNEDDIRKLFEKYGPLSEVNLPIDKITRKPKGFGTVTFLMPEHAMKAYTDLDGSILNGRMLHLLPGKTKTSPEDLAEGETNYKQKKELKLKATAGSSHNWNTLFLGQNAVVDAIANNYNTTKEKILEDGDGTSVAVRLALGETQLVLETQKFLEENGVQLNAFNQAPAKRSKTIILVKNLPAGTKSYELKELFEKFGVLGRIVLPPSGITALIEFIEPSEARKAFSKLAYTKFKHLPLYLEWAPDDSFTTATPSSKTVSSNISENKKNSKKESIDVESNEKQINNKENDGDDDDEDDDDEPEPETTIFVKNLNFKTTEETLKKYFSKCGQLHYANISMKNDPKNPGNKLSMGYAFVRYKLKCDADKALKQLQMTTLDGKTLELKRSERTLPTDVKTARKSTKITQQTGTKILVRNVPFQANAEEVKELFKAFGELKAVRLPKKMVGDEKHRGFAFVEYFTKKEAKRAFKTLSQSTHLYGRRLVLEWAQSDEGIEEIRKRTAQHFTEESSTRKSKKATFDPN